MKDAFTMPQGRSQGRAGGDVFILLVEGRKESSPALALAHICALTGVGAELLMCQHGQPVCRGSLPAGAELLADRGGGHLLS